MPIVTLSWSGDIAYGPRGARYELTQINGLWECRVFTDANQSGAVLASGDASRDSAMLAAQRHCEELTQQYGAESDAINGASDRQRVTIN